MRKEVPIYLINLIPKCEAAIGTRNKNFPTHNCWTACFKYSFFPSTLCAWFWLDVNIRNSEYISLFKSRLLSFIRPNQSKMFNIFDPVGLKLLTRLGLGLSHLNEHKFLDNFQDCLNPLYSCSLEIEETTYCLLHCQHFSNHRYDLMNTVKLIIPNFESLTAITENKIKHKLPKKHWKIFWVPFRIKFSLCGDFPF